ncbi:MAG: tetratricopeptide repeat protein [Rivularia sp. (in: cyanobacteria)]
MPEPQEPREYDAVLGGKNPPPVDGAVLGGIEGVKRRLVSKVVEVRVAALRDALNYGDAGLDLVIEALDDDSTLVEDAAVELLRTSKKNKAKLALLTNLLKIQPQNAHDYDKRGLMRQQLGDLEGAIADFSEAFSRLDYPNFLYNRGFCRQQLGDMQGAIADYNRTIFLRSNQYPDVYMGRARTNQYPDAYMGRARINTTLGNYQEAIEDYNFIIESNFNKNKTLKALAYHYRGAIYDILENYQQAIADANQAIELKHDNLEQTYENRGISRYKLGDFQGALTDFTQSIAINPNYYRVYHSRGFVKSAMGNHQEAIADFTQAIAINPNYLDAYIDRAVSRANSGDFIGAISDFSRTIESNPPSKEIYYYYRGVCHLSRKDYPNAIKDFSQAININPNYLDAYYNRGCCYFDIKNYPAAVNDFSLAIEINPEYIQAYSGRGKAYIALGEITKAEFDFQKVNQAK